MKKFIAWLKKLIGDNPPQKFEVGQEITPKCRIRYYDIDKNENAPGPKFGEVVTVIRYSHFNYKVGKWMIVISGYEGGSYTECLFQPLMTDAQLEELLKEQPLTEEVS